MQVCCHNHCAGLKNRVLLNKMCVQHLLCQKKDLLPYKTKPRATGQDLQCLKRPKKRIDDSKKYIKCIWSRSCFSCEVASSAAPDQLGENCTTFFHIDTSYCLQKAETEKGVDSGDRSQVLHGARLRTEQRLKANGQPCECQRKGGFLFFGPWVQGPREREFTPICKCKLKPLKGPN